MDAVYKLRVILSPTDIQKVTLDHRPESVENLLNALKEKLSLQDSFTLQYADPDFEGEMVNLTSINDLPEKSASIKVMYSVLEYDQFNKSDTPSLLSISSADSSHDTMSVSSNDEMQSLETKLRQGCWPEIFELPKFGPELELVLEDGNNKYLSDGKKNLVLGKDLKSQFLDSIANHIWSYKAYLSHIEYTEVAKAVMRKYPCLIEKGSSSGYDEMLNSIKFKMGNLRAKMRKLDCTELKVNSRKRSLPGSSSKPKKPKRAEINYLPDIPNGEDATSMEFYRETICTEVQKRNRDMNKIKKNDDEDVCLP